MRTLGEKTKQQRYSNTKQDPGKPKTENTQKRKQKWRTETKKQKTDRKTQVTRRKDLATTNNTKHQVYVRELFRDT